MYCSFLRVLICGGKVFKETSFVSARWIENMLSAMAGFISRCSLSPMYAMSPGEMPRCSRTFGKRPLVLVTPKWLVVARKSMDPPPTRFKGATLAEQIEFHSGWYQIVGNYSVRNLTKHTDKLAAIEGLAMFVPFSFIAGLWENVFAINLLWTLAKPSETRPDRKIPTWSWASVDGRISHQLRVRASSNLFNRGSWKIWTFISLKQALDKN